MHLAPELFLSATPTPNLARQMVHSRKSPLETVWKRASKHSLAGDWTNHLSITMVVSKQTVASRMSIGPNNNRSTNNSNLSGPILRGKQNVNTPPPPPTPSWTECIRAVQQAYLEPLDRGMRLQKYITVYHIFRNLSYWCSGFHGEWPLILIDAATPRHGTNTICPLLNLNLLKSFLTYCPPYLPIQKCPCGNDQRWNNFLFNGRFQCYLHPVVYWTWYIFWTADSRLTKRWFI